MDELNFKSWLRANSYSYKVASDVISRLKNLKRELGYIDFDSNYREDRCRSLLELFKNKGINEDMSALNPTNLPIGKYHLSTYKYSLSLYVRFLDDTI